MFEGSISTTWYTGGRVVGRVQNSSGLGPRGSSLLAGNNEGKSLRCEGWRDTQGTCWRTQRLAQLELDRLPYQSARSISKICIRRCEPVHIGAARLVPASTGALQCGREKCVPSFLPSRRLRPSSQLPSPRSLLASTGSACKATTMLARAMAD